MDRLIDIGVRWGAFWGKEAGAFVVWLRRGRNGARPFRLTVPNGHMYTCIIDYSILYSNTTTYHRPVVFLYQGRRLFDRKSCQLDEGNRCRFGLDNV
jgi:hypothetical protein